jgi:hypothetical protein
MARVSQSLLNTHEEKIIMLCEKVQQLRVQLLQGARASECVSSAKKTRALNISTAATAIGGFTTFSESF